MHPRQLVHAGTVIAGGAVDRHIDFGLKPTSDGVGAARVHDGISAAGRVLQR